MISLFKVNMHVNMKDLSDVLKSGYIGEGKQVKAFEKELDTLFKLEGIKTVNSATSALDLAMHMCGVGHGDEVITTAITCTATNSPAVNRGASIVWADVNAETGLIDPVDVGRKITKRTKAIIAVNWGGAMPDYKALKAYGIPVIEDAAHGPYWSANERGDYIVWSFQAIKHLTTGDGGALWTQDHNRVRLLRWYGLDRESNADFRCAQNIQEVGYKYHMNDIAATMGLANIKHLTSIVSGFNYRARLYDTGIVNPKIKKPVYSTTNPFWLYTIRSDTRDDLSKYLFDKGIASSQVHARNDKHDAFIRASKFGRTVHNNSLPGTDTFDDTQLSIPVGNWISYKDVQYIIETLNGY